MPAVIVSLILFRLFIRSCQGGEGAPDLCHEDLRQKVYVRCDSYLTSIGISLFLSISFVFSTISYIAMGKRSFRVSTNVRMLGNLQ